MPSDSVNDDTLTFAGNISVKATGVTIYGDFTISGTTAASGTVKDWLGHVYVNAISSSPTPSKNRSTIDWSGTASVTSRDYTQQSVPTDKGAQPSPCGWGATSAVPAATTTSTATSGYRQLHYERGVRTTGLPTRPCSARSCAPRRRTMQRQRDLRFTSQAHGVLLRLRQQRHLPASCRLDGHGDVLRPHGHQRVHHRLLGRQHAHDADRRGRCVRRLPVRPDSHVGDVDERHRANDSDSIAFNQSVVGAIATSSLHTTTTITQTVPGSWQQLPAN